MAKIIDLYFPDGSFCQHQFYCPACRYRHGFVTGPDAHAITGTAERPTIEPSIKAWYPVDADDPGGAQYVCHLVITDGVIDYQGDCTHGLAGMQVDMVEI